MKLISEYTNDTIKNLMSKQSEGIKNIKSNKTIERVNKNVMIKEIQKKHIGRES